MLSLHLGDLRVRVAFLLLGFKQFHLRRSCIKLVLRGSNLTRRSGSRLLQPLQCIQITLRDLRIASGLYQLRLQREHFFLIAATFKSAGVGFSRPYLRLCLCGLAARASRIKFNQHLASLNVVTFLYQNPFYCGSNGCVGLEILYRFNLAVCGNHATDGLAGNAGCGHRNRIIARRKRSQQYDSHDHTETPQQPTVSRIKAGFCRVMVRHSVTGPMLTSAF